MIDVRKVLKVCEQKDEFVLYFTAHNDADYNPVRKPEEGDYCAPYFYKTETLEEAIKQRDSLISVFDRSEILNGGSVPTPIHLKQPPGENAKSSAKSLLEMEYPVDVKDGMREAFTAGKYQDVQEIAANHDLVSRERLDSNITQIPNPDFKLIKGNVIEMVEGEEETKQISPYLFKAEGIEQTFTSAAAAISAYKEKNNIKTPDTTKHKIRKNHIQFSKRSELRSDLREVPPLAECKINKTAIGEKR